MSVISSAKNSMKTSGLTTKLRPLPDYTCGLKTKWNFLTPTFFNAVIML